MKNTGKEIPNLFASVRNKSPDKSSITGYCAEIFAPQKLHFPRRNNHDKIGILCHRRSGVLQL